jgi:hypothetical protein
MPPPKNPQQIIVFNGMANFYKGFIKKIVTIITPITKLTKKKKNFSLDRIMSKGLGIDQILVYCNTDIDITKLAGGVSCSYKCIFVSYGAMLSHNITRKNDQPIVYDYRLWNKIEQNYNIIERKALAMVFALHKFKHYLLAIMFFL